MAGNTLVIDARGRMILAVPGSVSPDMRQMIRDQFNAWRDAQPPELLIVPAAEVVRVVEIDIDLAPAEGKG